MRIRGNKTQRIIIRRIHPQNLAFTDFIRIKDIGVMVTEFLNRLPLHIGIKQSPPCGRVDNAENRNFINDIGDIDREILTPPNEILCTVQGINDKNAAAFSEWVWVCSSVTTTLSGKPARKPL